ncbi:MAG TPA: DUF3426 domain-containing protein, partial [Burkholderiaceae bacterium]|nr:DUF3426 domain-containing protein [Burkholderiaceae bacterium]
ALPEMDAEAAFAPTATRVLKELPPFVRAPKALTQAQSRPFVAAGWLAVLVLSALALVWQLAVHFQASVAARSPAIGDAIAAICRAAGCRLDLPLRLESVAVDSSGLTKAEGNGLYRLSVVLHNRGDTEVRVPAIDLSLTDDQGRVLGRKVLLPSELGSTRQGISPGTDLMLQGVLETGDIPAAGYTVEIFYP